MEEAWKDDVEAVERALIELINLTFTPSNPDEDTARRSEIQKLGGAAIAVELMEKRDMSSKIQGCTLNLMMNVTHSNSDSRVSFMQAGGLEASISAMKKYRFIGAVQRNGLGLLGNVASPTSFVRTSQ